MTSLASDPSLKFANGRLREAGARRLIEMKLDGHTYQHIAHELGVSTGTVFNIFHGTTWEGLREEVEASYVPTPVEKG